MLNRALSVDDTGPRPHGHPVLRARSWLSPLVTEVLAEGRGKKVSDSVPAIGPIQPLKRIGASEVQVLCRAGVQRRAKRAQGGVDLRVARVPNARRTHLLANKPDWTLFQISGVPDSESPLDALRSSAASDLGPQKPTKPWREILIRLGSPRWLCHRHKSDRSEACHYRALASSIQSGPARLRLSGRWPRPRLRSIPSEHRP